MKIVILGAGIIGVMSAYYLKKSGHDVLVIDRQSDAALETTFANGGQVSVCYSEPWSNFSNLKKMISWLGKEDSPILFKPKFDINQWSWGIKFLIESFPKNNHNNIISMLKIASYSRSTLQQLRKELNLNYEQITKGILTYYTTEKSFEAAKADSEFMIRYNCNRLIKSKEETFEIEPTLKNSSFNIVGSDYTEEDETGNAKLFTQLMKFECEKIGVQFLFEHEITDVKIGKNNIIENISVVSSKEITFDIKNMNARKYDKKKSFVINGDTFVCALGSYSSVFLNKIGIHVPIYPAKGYSATIDILDQNLVNNISLTDADKKIVFTKLGDKLRVAGTAEFNGYNLELNQSRCNVLVNRTKELIPNGLNFDSVFFWTGLRPSTPGNVPIIGKTKINNLYINSGHGTLGWTMGCGSGKLLSQIINKTQLYSME